MATSTLLSDPVTLTATFILGSASGALLTYLKQKHGLAKVLLFPKTPASVRDQPADSTSSFAMKALIIACNPEVISLLSGAFREKRISTLVCLPEAAVEQLSSDKFAAVVLDFDQFPLFADVLRSLPGANKHVPVIALATDNVSKAIASHHGATYIIENPLDPERLRGVLVSAYGRMLRESQVYFRLAIQLRVSIRRLNGDLLECTTLNLSQTGMAVNTPATFSVGEAIQLAFAIPNTEIFVSAEGKIIWDDKHGKAGISFECTSASVHGPFREWLHDHFHMKLASNSIPDIQQVLYAD